MAEIAGYVAMSEAEAEIFKRTGVATRAGFGGRDAKYIPFKDTVKQAVVSYINSDAYGGTEDANDWVALKVSFDSRQATEHFRLGRLQRTFGQGGAPTGFQFWEDIPLGQGQFEGQREWLKDTWTVVEGDVG